jgi:hypothetical protein
MTCGLPLIDEHYLGERQHAKGVFGVLVTWYLT